MTRAMLLAELLPDVAAVPRDLLVTGLVQDSRMVREGDAFVAIGPYIGAPTGLHGLGFVEEAKAAGASAILFEPPPPDAFVPPDDAIAVPRLRARMGEMANRFHDAPSHAMTMVGVTGTSGKTSTVQLIAQALQLRGRRSGTIGTLGAGLYGDAQATGFTTPLVLQTHELLARLRDAGADAVAMEVSSHALDQGRVDAVHYDVAVFTNLTRDHLDYHGDMDAYGAAKAKLFAREGLRAAVVNLDDAFGRKLHASLRHAHGAAVRPANFPGDARRASHAPFPPLSGERAGVRGSSAEGASAFDLPNQRQEATSKAPLTPTLSPASGGEGVEQGASKSVARLRVIGTSARANADAQVRAENVALDAAGIAFDLVLGDARHPVRSPLLGRFNVDNLLAVAGVLHALGEAPDAIAAVLPRLEPIPGRMNRLGGADGLPLVVVDYSHKPDPLQQALESLRGHLRGRLVCVFGCGGERDRGKRPQMAKIAEDFADIVIVTDDNPRGEDGDAIVAEIVAGLARPQDAIVERDRRRAIERAIGQAGPDDIVLVAGKGHESYQEVAGVKHAFDDTEAARSALEARR
jgi:UDP-N-acetylmuramoyl-L-alanyl-D-glutamate--2,6-diaminopimelate ligase